MSTSTLAVTEFVTARLDDMERSVDVPDWYSTDSVRGEGWGSRGEECPLCGAYMFEGTEAATEDGWEMHMADRHGRILAECAAMRAIVEEYRGLRSLASSLASQGLEGEAETARAMYAGVGLSIVSLAAIWSDHADFREEWRS